MPNCISDHLCEGCLTKLAELLIGQALRLDRLYIKCLGQTVGFANELGFLAKSSYIEVCALPVDHDGLGRKVTVHAHSFATPSTIEVDCRLIHIY